MEKMDIINDTLGGYGFTTTIAYALRLFLKNPYESLLIVDKDARIQFMDSRTEKYLGLKQGGAKGADIREFVPQSGLPMTLETGKPMIGRIFELNGKKRIGSLYPIIHQGQTVGAVGRLIFQSLEEVERINNEIKNLKKEINYLKEKEQYEYSSRYTFENILGESALMKDAVELAKKIAMINTDVLIVGESGTGKELFAHSIHGYAHGNRPIIKINCPAIPFELAESELFGYEKGAFSGALSSGKQGKFEVAHNGTIFLDEISSLSLSIQAKLLRVLQEREIERLGGTKTRKINFRIIAATNTDLKELVKEGKFREDLYYRIAKAIFPISPLRERTEDIPLYLSHFLEKINQSFGTRIKKISPQAMAVILQYQWPGNVRELINVVEQAVLKAWKGEAINEEHLPSELRANLSGGWQKNKKAEDEGTQLFKTEIAKREKDIILSALEGARGSRTKAARILRMPRSTLYEKIKRYGL
jgi:transcriptional regulator with PAS, ATPase and Fis domain